MNHKIKFDPFKECNGHSASNCCGKSFLPETDICAGCKEHASPSCFDCEEVLNCTNSKKKLPEGMKHQDFKTIESIIEGFEDVLIFAKTHIQLFTPKNFRNPELLELIDGKIKDVVELKALNVLTNMLNAEVEVSEKVLRKARTHIELCTPIEFKDLELLKQISKTIKDIDLKG